MSTISTHVLDTARGVPAPGIPLQLDRLVGGDFVLLGEGTTDDDGRVRGLLPDAAALVPGTYRMHFDVAAYLERTAGRAFYPHVDVVFVVTPGGGHHHIPLLLSPYGYSTYRGS